ncbi:hypothetical protein CP532_0479 [Ophiocordyceps camponoti-leonardi (nom. inval.)]|nr:hypothetical protein CP532_0479 [Ophiocordyceps camponoti-leonardi (nom. inval.)]
MGRPAAHALRQLSRPKWSCLNDQKRIVSQRRWGAIKKSYFNKNKSYYITTPIFYVNDAPHIGHLYSMVLADALKRWQQINGVTAFLSTGTDEHGLKVQQAAERLQVSPKELCDANSAKFRQLARMAGISADFFIRTTDEKHKLAVSKAYAHLKSNLSDLLGLYEGTHEGWYSISDECFYTDQEVEQTIEPQTGQKITVSLETGSEVKWIKDKTWFFPVSEYKIQLLEFYQRNPRWIVPKTKMEEVRHWVEKQLEDLAVTRPTSRLQWGIRDPHDDSQVIYVWLDALINYITNAGYGQKGQVDLEMWPADLHVIGKDILRFHAIYWPAILMALNLPLPRRIVCHNHWTLGSRKMSKSVGNVVDPFLALQRWDTDTVRYFLLSKGSLKKDMDYSNNAIRVLYIKELQAGIGNALQRICKPKTTHGWSVEEAVRICTDPEFYPPGGEKSIFMTLHPILKKLAPVYTYELSRFDFQAALGEISRVLRELNRYISDSEPWRLALKHRDPKKPESLNRHQRVDLEYKDRSLHWVIYNSVEALRIVGILLQPVMPNKAAQLLDDLGVSPDMRTAEYAGFGQDKTYGKPRGQNVPDGVRIKKWNTLFPPLPDTEEWPDDIVPEKLKPELHQKTKNKMNQLAEVLANEAREGISREADEEEEEEEEEEKEEEEEEEELLEATASEPLSLKEEFENQLSWHDSRDKLTFIIYGPDGLAKGDVNLFLDERYEGEDEDKHVLEGEVDVMIARRDQRGMGLGSAAVMALMTYFVRNKYRILGEYFGPGGPLDPSLTRLKAKIKEGNGASRALFRSLGFVQVGEPDHFGEVTVVMEWKDVHRRVWAWLRGGELEYREGTVS